MRYILVLFLTIIKLTALTYKEVYKHEVFLNSTEKGILKLYEENTSTLAEHPAKIVIEYQINGAKKEFVFSEAFANKDKYYFSENSKRFPIYYFKNIEFNSQKKKIVDLTKGINVFDTDGNKNNEIFIYGTSHYGGSGFFGKVVILEKNNDTIKLKAPIIEANDNFEIKYFKDRNIIIVAQYIWRNGVEAHYGDKHLYKFYIYEIDNGYKKIPIFLSKKMINDEIKNIIEENIDDILNKFDIYKKGKLSKSDEKKIISFVSKYWEKVSEKDFDFINMVFDTKAFYYSKIFSKDDIIKDKKRALKKYKKINFKLSDFLVYKKDDRYIVEYTKAFDMDDGKNYGVVKSLFELKELNGSFMISTEKDLAVLGLKKDI